MFLCLNRDLIPSLFAISLFEGLDSIPVHFEDRKNALAKEMLGTIAFRDVVAFE